MGAVRNFPLGAWRDLALRERMRCKEKPARARNRVPQTSSLLWKDADPDIPILKKPRLNTRGCSSCWRRRLTDYFLVFSKNNLDCKVQ